MTKLTGCVWYPNAWCPRCRKHIQCVQQKGRVVNGIECPECKEYCCVVSRSKAPLKGVEIGVPLFLEE